MTYTPLDLEIVAGILHTEGAVCVYQMAVNLAVSSTVMHALDILPDMEQDGAISVERKSGHPVIYHTVHCAMCGWCPVRQQLRHGPYAASKGIEPHCMDNVSQPKAGPK